MNRVAGGTAGRIHRRASLESRWQEWVSQPLPGCTGGRPAPANGNSQHSHDAIALLAYALWEQRGCPWGEAEQDWYRAEQQLAE